MTTLGNLIRKQMTEAWLKVCTPMADWTTIIRRETEELMEEKTEGLGKLTKEISLNWLNNNFNQADFNLRDLD